MPPCRGTNPAAPQARRVSSWQEVSGPGISQFSPARQGLEVACYAMWAGTALLLPLAPGTVTASAHAPTAAIGAAVYLGLLPSALGFVIWGYAVARTTLAVSTAALYLVPPVAIAVAFVWLGEAPHWIELAGGVLGIAGVVLINRRRPRAGVVRSAGAQRSVTARVTT